VRSKRKRRRKGRRRRRRRRKRDSSKRTLIWRSIFQCHEKIKKKL